MVRARWPVNCRERERGTCEHVHAHVHVRGRDDDSTSESGGDERDRDDELCALVSFVLRGVSQAVTTRKSHLFSSQPKAFLIVNR